MPASRPCSNVTCHKLAHQCAEHRRKPFATRTPKRAVAGSGWAWQRLRKLIIERDGGLCRLRLEGCTRTAITADHIIGVAAGGSDAPSNLAASCGNCNEQHRRQQAREGRVGG